MIGAYNAINVAAAIACATHIAPNLSQGDIQRALDKIKPEAHRLNLIKLNSGKELLDDCYNSSPTAMLSVLKLLSACKSRGKRIGLVLGGMHEMGDHVEHYHQIVAAEIIKLAPEFCFVVGEVGKNYISALKDANFPVKWFAAPTEVVAPLDAATFDLALVKGSRGVRLDLLIDETLSNLNTAC
jgi:UDP-N-acetylmuramoyl-tripeptide--D-alanyl-D-alanine ligase